MPTGWLMQPLVYLDFTGMIFGSRAFSWDPKTALTKDLAFSHRNVFSDHILGLILLPIFNNALQYDLKKKIYQLQSFSTILIHATIADISISVFTLL